MLYLAKDKSKILQKNIHYPTSRKLINILSEGTSDMANNGESNNGKTKCPHCDMEELPCDKCSSAALGGKSSSKKPTNPDPNGFFGEMEDDETGRHLVALKDIPAGTILWTEDPLVAAPSNMEIFTQNGVMTCPGCVSLVPKYEMVKCSKCGWLVCEKKCAEMPDHKLNECAHKASFSYSDSGTFSLLAYRITLLKKRDPAKYADLMALRDSITNQLDPMVDYLKKFQLEAEMYALKISRDKMSLEEYEKIFHIMKLNSLGLSAYYEDTHGEKRFGWGLYKTTSLMTYSCIPNCGLQIDLPPTHKIRVHSTVLIKKGERLTRFCRERIAGLKYLGGVAQRQQALQQDGFAHFRCKCSLCSDSTENGTNLSTLICQTCKKPSLLPINPGAQAIGTGNFDDWTWKCGTMGCSGNVKNSELSKLNEIILQISKAVPMTEKDFKACSNRWPQLKTSFANRVHPNYWAIVASASELCRQYWHCYAPPFDSPDWSHQEEIMLYLLPIFDIIRPGLSPERARLQHRIMKAWFVELFTRTLPPLNFSRNPAQFSAAISKLEAAIEMGKESLKYYKLDPRSKMLSEVEGIVKQLKETLGRVTMTMMMAQMDNVSM